VIFLDIGSLRQTLLMRHNQHTSATPGEEPSNCHTTHPNLPQISEGHQPGCSIGTGKWSDLIGQKEMSIRHQKCPRTHQPNPSAIASAAYLRTTTLSWQNVFWTFRHSLPLRDNNYIRESLQPYRSFRC